jgi:hypothetical protein
VEWQIQDNKSPEVIPARDFFLPRRLTASVWSSEQARPPPVSGLEAPD